MTGTTAGNKGRIFTGRVVGSIVVFSIMCAVCLVWLVTLVLIPMFTTPFKFTPTGIVSLGFDVLITWIILFAIVHNSLDLVTSAALRIRKPKGKAIIKRFSVNERLQHLWLLITTAVSALTGFAIMYYASWGKSVVNLLGGFEATLDLHYASAILMGILVVYHFGFYTAKYFANRALGRPTKLDINFSWKDLTDFFANMKYYAGRGQRPKYDKYSYSQRFDYWGIYWGMVILGAPGVMMWALGVQAFGGVAYIFHVKEALLAVLFLGVFHFYQSHYSPRQFPGDATFLTGTVTEQEMEEDHPLEIEHPLAWWQKAEQP